MRRGDSALKGREVARSGSKGSRNEVTSNKVRWNEVEWVQVKESMAYNDPAPTLPLVISSFLLCLSVVPIRMSMSSKIKKSNKQGRCSLSFSFFLSTFHFVLEKPDQFLDLIALYSTLSISTQPPHLHSPFFLSHRERSSLNETWHWCRTRISSDIMFSAYEASVTRSFQNEDVLSLLTLKHFPKLNRIHPFNYLIYTLACSHS